MPEKTMSEKHSMPERTERPERQERPERKSRAEPNVVYVGIKPVMAYVLAVVTQFHTGSKEVTIKARGRSISRAVDTAEVVRHKFMPDVKVKDIRIATEEMDGREGGRVNCSSIEICLGP